MKPRRHVPARLLALRVARAQLGTVETTPNWSPQIRLYLASAGITVPAAWCMAFVHWCYVMVGVQVGGGASVGNFTAWAKENGGTVVRPFRGDVVAYDWNGDGWPDHVGLVERVLAVRWKGRVFAGWIQTVEGNTSSGQAGSQDDGDGVYRRRRWASRCVFVRVQG